MQAFLRSLQHLRNDLGRFWFAAWDVSFGDKVFEAQTWFRHGASFLALKAISYGEVSGEIGWCSTISNVQWISEFHLRVASSIDETWLGLQPVAYFLASENGAFGCCWYWICDALERTVGLLLLLLPWFGYS